MTTHEYLRSYKNYFWQWEDSLSVAAIPNGATIAYFAQIEQIIEKLNPNGLPRLGTILLTLVATNPNAEANLEFITPYFSAQQFYQESINFLRLLSKLPPAYREGVGRLSVLQTIFTSLEENPSRISSKAASIIFLQIKNKHYDIQILNTPNELQNILIFHDIKILAQLSKIFPTEQDILKKMAGLIPILSENKVLELPTSPLETVQKDFIQELIETEETFFMGSLVKHIWSGLDIPTHYNLPSEQPLGGISDLTNKGDFDKLLISEFAHDDLTFLSRLANNEALYIQREIPPSNNKVQRIILIDTSIKNWGTPKTIAYSLMIAIAKHPKTVITCVAFAIGENVKPIFYEDIHALIESNRLVEPCMHAGRGLEVFFKDYKQLLTPHTELFFISSQEAVKKPAMQKILNEYAPRIHYWIYTDANGKIALYKGHAALKKHIQDILLPLEKLWANPPKKKYKPKKQTLTDIQRLPILMSNRLGNKNICVYEDSVFHIVKDKIVLNLYNATAQRGWQVSYVDTEVYPSHSEIGMDTDGDYILLMFTIQSRKLSLLNLRTHKKIVVEFRDWGSASYTHFIFVNQSFYFLGVHYYWKINFDGSIERLQNVPQNLYDTHKNKLEKIKTIHSQQYSNYNILKNIYKVGINEQKNLVINSHEFYLNKGGVIKFDDSKNLKKQVEAVANEYRTIFTFPDGSYLEVLPVGISVLCSANPAIPSIYIPTVIDRALGVSTEDEFAGNDYYYRDADNLLKISTQAFFEKYIHPFILSILTHHAATTTTSI